MVFTGLPLTQGNQATQGIFKLKKISGKLREIQGVLKLKNLRNKINLI